MSTACSCNGEVKERGAALQALMYPRRESEHEHSYTLLDVADFTPLEAMEFVGE